MLRSGRCENSHKRIPIIQKHLSINPPLNKRLEDMADYDATPDASAAPHPDSILRLASAVHRFSIVSTI